MNEILVEIIDVLTLLDGEAKLSKIYDEIEKRNLIDLSHYVDWKSVIRKNIYLHSEECDIYDGKEVFFKSKYGKYKGYWILRK